MKPVTMHRKVRVKRSKNGQRKGFTKKVAISRRTRY